MKNIFYLIILSSILFSNCKKNDDYQFEMKYFGQFTIPSGLNPFSGTHVFEINNIKTNSTDIFSQNGVTAESISVINPGESILEAIFGGGQYSYAREISIKMFTADNPNYVKEIFYHDVIPQNHSGNLALLGTLVDAKEFLVGEEFSIRVEFQLRDFTPESTDTRIDFSFFVR